MKSFWVSPGNAKATIRICHNTDYNGDNAATRQSVETGGSHGEDSQ
jgi:hypothetical protein